MNSDKSARQSQASATARQQIEIYMRRISSRLVANGIDPNDIERALADITSLEDYIDGWARLGEQHEKRAGEELASGHALTARQAWLLATACYRVAQYEIVFDTEQKVELLQKEMICYRKAAKLFQPPIEVVDVPYLNASFLPCYLWLPPHTDNPPCVIIVGGAGGWREEFHNFCEGLIARGLAVLITDGPGQGEARIIRKIYMPVDLEKAFSACVDYLSGCGRVNKDRIGIVGHSFGGYLVSRTAAYEKRIKACVCLGGFYDMLSTIYQSASPTLRGKFQAQFGARDLNETEEIARQFTLKGLAEKIACPLLVVHGHEDEIVPVE